MTPEDLSGRIDWSRPIEAVHENGRVERIEPTTLPSQNNMHYAGRVGAGKFAFAKDGYPLSALCPWRIRNVAEPHYASVHSSGVPDVLVERMAAVVRWYASGGPGRTFDGLSPYAEAKAIVALLPGPVDPDEAEAERIIRDLILCNDDDITHRRVKRLLVDAVRAGRALASRERTDPAQRSGGV
jgi:hypothetical protein